jgi:hypothetical protein
MDLSMSATVKQLRRVLGFFLSFTVLDWALVGLMVWTACDQ